MDRFHCEFRAAGQDAGRISGHAHVFGRVAQIRGGFERVSPAAFNRALAERQDVVLLVNHEGLPLGRTTSGTLRLSVDERGLTIDNDLPDTTLARDVRELMGRGDLRSMSFGFIPTDGVLEEVEGRQIRTITDLDLFDVSIVTHPAYAGTEVALRSFDSLPPIVPAAPETPDLTSGQLLRPRRVIAARSRLEIGRTK
jgi:hypothetical protein